MTMTGKWMTLMLAALAACQAGAGPRAPVGQGPSGEAEPRAPIAPPQAAPGEPASQVTAKPGQGGIPAGTAPAVSGEGHVPSPAQGSAPAPGAPAPAPETGLGGPAEPVAPPPPALASPGVPDPAELEVALASIRSASDVAAGCGLLGRLGFDAAQLPSPAEARLTRAELYVKQLDRDADLDRVVHLTFASAAPDGQPGSAETHFLAWLDPTGAGLAVLGRHDAAVESCVADGSFDVRFEPVHAPALDDAIVRSVTAPDCNGDIGATTRVVVLSAERGKIERLLEFEDTVVVDRVTHNVLDPALDLRLAGAAPKRAEVVDERGRVKRVLRFDPAAFAYR
ncbi:MAG: hypothetical protein HY744_03085 [Deltaproteobacteria bacterium]|nr:hypothetical protein [Deltaproteobacteria bacterium]